MNKEEKVSWICLRDFLDWEGIEECCRLEHGVKGKLSLDLEPKEAKVIIK